MIKISIVVEADTKEELRDGLREARRAGLPVSRGYVRSPSSLGQAPCSEGAKSPSEGSSVKERLTPLLSPQNVEFLFGVIAKLAEPERQMRLQDRLPGKGRSRLGKLLKQVKTACTTAGIRYEDILDVRDNDKKGASREKWIGPGPLLRRSGSRAEKQMEEIAQ